MFTSADIDGDQSIDQNELMQLFERLGIEFSKEMQEKMLKDADTNKKDGKLDFEEFKTLIKNVQNKKYGDVRVDQTKVLKTSLV